MRRLAFLFIPTDCFKGWDMCKILATGRDATFQSQFSASK